MNTAAAEKILEKITDGLKRKPYPELLSLKTEDKYYTENCDGYEYEVEIQDKCLKNGTICFMVSINGYKWVKYFAVTKDNRLIEDDSIIF